jgi:bud site selection protein 20
VKFARDDDLAGSGQNYCVACDRHFVDKSALKTHWKSKVHKSRLKAVSEPPHTQQDAEDCGKF